MAKTKSFIVDIGPLRVDKYLVQVLENTSRNELKGYFDEHKIYVNGKIARPSYTVRPGDEVILNEKETIILDVEKEDIPLDIIYEDSDVIVVNKKSGMVVHPAFGHYRGTLVNALMHHCTDLSSINGVVRAGIVHRIDKDTSGLIVACKNDLAHRSISLQLRNKTATRKYFAIVYGSIPHNLGRIDAPIGRHPTMRKKMAVVEGGKEAVTTFNVIERFQNFTLVELSLETGRTHQIRVHMSYIGYPLLGDPLYGPKKVYGDTGQYLHAKTLGFLHPRTNEYLEFESELPDNINNVINLLRDKKL